MTIDNSNKYEIDDDLEGNDELRCSRKCESNSINIDQMIGTFGRWQLNAILFYIISYILSPINNLGYVLQSAKTDLTCVELPKNSFDTDPVIQLSDQFNNETTTLVSITNYSFYSPCNQTCGKWIYNNSLEFDETITSKFNLICGQEWLGSFAQSMYQMGYVFSGIFIGWLSDKYGRKLALQVSILFEIIGGISLMLSNSIYFYIFSRLILGLGDSGRGMSLFMIITETVDNVHRADILTGCNFGWITGYILLPIIAYFLRNYIYIQIIPTLIIVLMGLIWLPRIDESPRWLMANEKYPQAKNVLRRACCQNKRMDNFEAKFDQLKRSKMNQTKTANSGNLWQMVFNRKYSIITLILWFSFFVNGFIYHGFSLNIEIIGGNVYYNFALAGIVEIPSVLINLIGLKFIGRRAFTICSILSAAICYAIIVNLRIFYNLSDDNLLLILLSMMGKMFVFASFNTIYIHASEIFPTKFRQSGVSSCSIIARVGSTMAPFVKDLNTSLGLTNTIIIFGSLSLAAAIGTLFLPETRNEKLKDTME